VALTGPPAFVVASDLLFGKAPSLSIEIVVQLLYCGMAAVVVWGVVHWEHLPLHSIGIRRPSWATVVTAAVLVMAGLYLLPLLTNPLATSVGVEGRDAGLHRLAALPLWFRIVVGVTGGAVEETLYRGYAIERLGTVTGRRWLGATLAMMAFALAHIPAWGAALALTSDLSFGVIMTLSYLWRRDLLANILAHSTGLVVAMMTAVP
jgi:membrane protease YdiL (CAAX protease family)